MKLASSRLIERAAENLGDDLAALHKVGATVAGRFIEDTGKLTKRARYKLRNGANRAVELEEKVVADFQTRPLAYALVTLGLICAVTLKIVFDRQKKDHEEE